MSFSVGQQVTGAVLSAPPLTAPTGSRDDGVKIGI